MYSDYKPCQVCGAEVRLAARADDPVDGPGSDASVGSDFVGDGDSPVDERVCTNPQCDTNQPGADVSP